jgi:hypothetical protein
MLPKTDAVLSLAINISIGVTDRVLGLGSGIFIQSNAAEIEEKAAMFRRCVSKHL